MMTALISHEHTSQAASSSSITSLALRSRLEMFTGVWQVLCWDRLGYVCNLGSLKRERDADKHSLWDHLQYDEGLKPLYHHTIYWPIAPSTTPRISRMLISACYSQIHQISKTKEALSKVWEWPASQRLIPYSGNQGYIQYITETFPFIGSLLSCDSGRYRNDIP